MAEIISDYRQPRPGDSRSCCVPGEVGFDSVIHLRSETHQKQPLLKQIDREIWRDHSHVNVAPLRSRTLDL